MAKEMMIVFVYDGSQCNQEDDDPVDAVLYFHPAWVSPTQRLALAGQLMGVNQFLSTSFAPLSLISLQGGKFVLKKFGSYVLAVGTDRNIHDWILERRADILETLIKFFHCDFNTILSSLNGDRNKFIEKLYQIFEIYLPILQYNANLFSNIPILKLPRSASNIFLEAIQVLQYCQETSSIIGGCVFYNNKVVVSQLNAQITKQLIITDPYRIKSPAEKITTTFHLPIGVQLLRIYIHQPEYTKMVQDANTKRMYHSSENRAHKKESTKSTKDQPVSLMKRDTSRIFTVPEDSVLETDYRSKNQYHSSSTSENSPAKQQDTEAKDRPKFQNPQTPSICSTPLSNVNRILHGTAVSICNIVDEHQQLEKSEGNTVEKPPRTITIKPPDPNEIPDVVKEALRCKRLNKLRNAAPSKIPSERSQSMPDLDDTLRKYSHRVCLRTYSLGLPKLNNNLCLDIESPKRHSSKKRAFRTITDPCFPMFRWDGLPCSGFLYDQYIASHLGQLGADFAKDEQKIELLPLGNKKPSEPVKSIEKDKVDLKQSKTNFSLDVRLKNKNKQEVYRRSMSLPLKPLNAPDADERCKSSSEFSSGVFELTQRRKLEGLQLTPLMSKLSLLADERTSGFCSRETTPSEFRDLSSSLSTGITKPFVKSKPDVKDVSSDADDDIVDDWTSDSNDISDLVKCELFVCGHQNMLVVLIMENGASSNPDLIHLLWETCVSTLGKLEIKLQQCLDPLPTTESKELYSVLSIDSEWDTTHRSGLWGVTELDMVSLLHDRLTKAPNITDIILRTEDTVIYGNQCGKVQVFYQQAITSNTCGGLPTPADLMGVVPLKAKRRLERDHGIMLL